MLVLCVEMGNLHGLQFDVGLRRSVGKGSSIGSRVHVGIESHAEKIEVVQNDEDNLMLQLLLGSEARPTWLFNKKKGERQIESVPKAYPGF